MQRFRYFSLLLILILIAGPALAIPAGTIVNAAPNLNNGNNLGLDDVAYLNQVISPAKAAHQELTPEQRTRYLEIMRRQIAAAQAGPRRDRAGGPDDQGYRYKDSDENGGPAYNWVDIVNMGGAQSWNMGDDDGTWADLGFNYTWYGNEYNRIWICSNGFISLSEQRYDYNFAGWGQLPTGNAPANFLGPLMSDYNMGAGGTLWFFSDENQAVITWDGVAHYSYNGNNTFQVIITRDGNVTFQYQAIGVQEDAFLTGAQNQAKDRGFEVARNVDGYPAEGMAIAIGPRWVQFDGPGIEIRPAELAFGNVALQHQGVIRATISNVGAEQLNITGVACDDQAFILPQIDQEVQIASGGSVQVDVGFAPGAAGDYAADIRISCNAENAQDGIFTIRATGHGFAGPILTVDPQSIDDELNTGERNEYAVTLGNDGGSELNYTVEVEIIREAGGRDAAGRGVRSLDNAAGPNRDNPGDLIGQFNGINAQNQYSSCVGWDWDNERMWVSNYNQRIAAAYTHDNGYDNFQEVLRINTGGCMDGAWADGLLFLGDWAQAVVNRYNAAGQNIGAIQFPFAVYGIGADVEEELLFVLSGNDNTIKVFQLDGNGGVNVNNPIGSIQNHQQFHNNIQAYGLDWVPKHPDGQLWMTAYNQPRVHQISVNTANWTCTADVQSFQVSAAGDQPYCGVAHDGHNLWAAGYANANIRVYDDGVTEAYWLLFAPEAGAIQPGGSEDLFITLDAAGLFEGDYEADVHILSNDAGQADFTVNVHMFVHGAPDVDAVWAERLGYPDVVNWNSAYADLFTGHAYDVVIKVSNEGTADLTVDGFDCDNNQFTASPAQFVLSAGEEQNVTLTLAAQDDGDHNGTFTIFSDDPDESQYNFAVQGTSGTPPTIALEPGSIEDELFTGGAADHVVTVSNDGGTPLRFTIEKEVISEPGGRDSDLRGVRSLDGAVGPARDNAGDLLGQFQGINQQNIYCSPVGWDWDNERMWVTQYNNGLAAAYTHDAMYQNFAEVARINCGSNMDGCWADGFLWVPTSLGAAQVNKWNSAGQNVGNVNFGFGVYGLAADVNEEWLFVLSSNDQGIHVFPLDGNGNVGGQIGVIAQGNHMQYHGNVTQYGMEWVSDHPDGQLWFCNYNDRNIYQIAVNTVDWTCTETVQRFQVFPANDQPYSSSAHDGANMWVAGHANATIRVYDDGVSEVRWLMTDVEEGEIGAHGSMDVTVMLNAAGLVAGDYVADLHFKSNDPDRPDETVNVSLAVSGASDITVEWSERGGFPDVIDFNRLFVDVFSGGPYNDTITVRNDGSDDLDVQDVYSDMDYFTADPVAFVLSPDEEQSVIITFNAPADDPGDYNATFTVQSNDPDEGEYHFAAHAQASSPPAIVVDPAGIEDDMTTGDIHEHTLNVANDGQALLRFSIDKEIISEPGGRDADARQIRNLVGAPVRDDAGELLGQFQGINQANVYCSPIGWDWDNERMWVVQYNNQLAAAYTHDNNYQNFQEVARMNVGNNMDGCWADGLVFIPASLGQAVVNRWNAAGQNIGAINFGFGVYGLAADVDEEWLFVLSSNDWFIHVFPLDGNGGVGQQIGVIQNHLQFHGNVQEYGIEWVGKHADGQLWYVNYQNAQIYQIAVDTDNWTCTETFQQFQVLPGADQPYSNSAHDGHNMWVGGYVPATIRVYDDGNAEISWLSFAPAEGELQGGADMDISVVLNATGLLGGDYVASMHFMSNDPANPDTEVSVTVHVTGAPNILVEWDEAWGYNEEDADASVLDFNRAFDDVFAGGPYTVNVDVTNTGTEDLSVDGAYGTDEVFSVNPDSFVLTPDETRSVEITFNSADAIEYTTTVVFPNNSANNSEYAINVHADAATPPIIVVDPVQIDDDLMTGDIHQHTINVANDGDADLRFTTDSEILAEPGDRDGVHRNIRSLTGAARIESGSDAVAFNPNAVVATTDPSWNARQLDNTKASAIREGSGPRRDELESNFAYFKEADGWGNIEAIWQAAGANMTMYSSNDMPNFPINDFDVIWIREYQSDGFNTNWNNNRARFEDWIDGGGVLYHATATNNWNVLPISPGGLQRINQNVGNGTVVVSRDPQADNYNYLAELMGWNGGENLPGSSWEHSNFSINDIENLENSDYYQVIATPAGMNDKAGVAVYTYGRGTVVVSGTTDSHQYVNYRNAGNWGLAVAQLPIYFDYLANATQWLSWDPTDGTIGSGGDMDVTVTLDATGLLGGDYQAALYFLSNDPATPREEVMINMTVTGVPVVAAEWIPGFANGVVDFNAGFQDLFSGGPYRIPVSIQNTGTEDLAVSEINCDDNAYFSADPTEFVVTPGEEQVVVFTLNAEENGDHRGTMVVVSNANNNDHFPINVHGQTSSPPIMVVDPMEIHEELPTGEQVEPQINISNDGAAVLRWSTEVEILAEGARDANGREIRNLAGSPRRDDAGELLGQFQGINQQNVYCSPVGWDWDNERMWVTQYNNQLAAAYTHDANYQNFEEVLRINCGNNMDGCWVDGFLWVPTSLGSAQVNKWDSDGQNVGNVNFGFGVYGLAADRDNEWLFVLSSNDWFIHVFPLDGQGGVGNQIGVIQNHLQFHGNVTIYGMEWAPKDADGQLWFINYSDQNAYQIAVDTDNWTCTETVQTFRVLPGADQPYNSCGHDEKNIWVGGYGPATIRVYDDGVFEPYWFSYSPDGGELEAGADTNINVVLDATGLLGGHYEADLSISSNDPANPLAVVNVTLDVTGVGNIEVNPGGPDFEPVDFDVSYIDYGKTVQLAVENVGTDVLEITGIQSDNQVFGVNANFPINVAIEEVVNIDAWFNPAETGNQNATLTFATNDPRYADGYPVRVMGLGLGAPDLDLSRNEVEVDLFTGEGAEEIVGVANSGESMLNWTTELEVIAEPGGRDAAARGIRSLAGARPVENVANGAAAAVRLGVSSTDASWNGNQARPVNAVGAVVHHGVGPSRDVPESNFLLVQETSPWGYDLERIFQEEQGISYTRIRTPDQLDQLDINDFDVVWFGNYESDGWNQQYNNHLDMIEEWVDGGGSYYMCSGTNNWGTAPTHPGGLVRTPQVYDQTGITVLTQEENFLFDLMDWDEGTQLQGNSFCHAVYDQDNIDNIQNTDGAEVMVVSSGAQRPAILNYNYGRGWCVVSGSTDGFLHNNPGQYLWGQAGLELLYYLDFLSNASRWLEWAPEEGNLDVGGDVDVVLTFVTEGLIGGDYEADLHFFSNDPADGDQIVSILMHVTGAPTWTSEPAPGGINFPNTYVEGESNIPVTVTNNGTDVLVIQDVALAQNANDFGTDLEANTQVAPGDEMTFNVMFHPVDIGNRNGTLDITTNARNLENGIASFALAGVGMTPPQISTSPAADGEIYQSVPLGHAPIDRALTISNVADNGGDNLNWEMTGAEADQGRDAASRSVRSLVAGPSRDAAGDQLASYDSPISTIGGMAFDGTNVWGCSYGSNRMASMDLNGNVVASIGIHASPLSMTYDGDRLWVGAWSGSTVYTYNLNGDNLESFNLGFQQMCGMGSDQAGLVFINCLGDQRIHVINSADHNEVTNFAFRGAMGNADIWGIDWVPSHRGGQLWGNSTGHLWQASVDADWNVNAVQDFGWNSDQPYVGPAHDGTNMWHGMWNETTWYVFDDGVAELKWFQWDPKEGSIGPGQSQDVTVTFDSEGLDDGADYHGVLTIASNDPTAPFVNINVTLHVGAVEHHFLYTVTADNASVLVTGATFENEAIPNGWEIGVFTPGGVCSGGDIWAGEALGFAAWAAEGDVAQFTAGERMNFKFWDNNADVEYDARATVSEGSINWAANGYTVLSLAYNAEYTCVVPLTGGWNLISINITPNRDLWNANGPDIRLMMAQFREEARHQVILMKNERGNFYAPANNNFNNIPFWNTAEGYQVRMNEAREGRWTGVQIDAQADVPIAAGWNMIAYFPTYQLTCARNSFRAFSPIIDYVVLAKDGFGHFASPRNNFSNMDPWREGRGYQINVSEAVVLNYPAAQQGAAAIEVGESDASVVGRWAEPATTGANMSVLVTSVSGMKLAADDQVAAFSTSGRLVGVGHVTEGMVGLAVWGDDASTEAVDGLQNGEAFTLKLWNADKNEVVDLQMAGLVYVTDGFAAGDAAASAVIPNAYSLGQNFPNPFNAVTRIAFGLPEASRVSIRVFDVAGREVATLVSGELQAGNHTAVWSAEGFNSGVYLVKMETPGFSDVRKVTLVK